MTNIERRTTRNESSFDIRHSSFQESQLVNESMPARNTHATGRWYAGITRYQWLVLVIASLGWVFDAFEGPDLRKQHERDDTVARAAGDAPGPRRFLQQRGAWRVSVGRCAGRHCVRRA